jgi:hydrogenase expression/formation protein HypD
MNDLTRERVRTAGQALFRLVDRPLRFMEVCGTHTVSIYRSGLRALFPTALSLVSGPGCPVCVTAQEEIDTLVRISRMEGLVIATYGDMLRVPGSQQSLAEARAQGASVQVVLSAASALDLARETPDKTVVFAAVGFETTAPATAAVVLQATRENRENFLVLNLHKTVPTVLGTLAADPALALDGFLLPGHVSVILGLSPYAFLAEKYGLACVVAGFEPDQIMAGLVMLALQKKRRSFSVQSAYPQAVRSGGNDQAKAILDTVFDETGSTWRGLGFLPRSGLRLKDPYSRFDARVRLQITDIPAPEPPGCRCGDVLAGRIAPFDCPLFGGSCTPEEPVGPCMVSSEGSCSAAYRYGRSEWS